MDDGDFLDSAFSLIKDYVLDLHGDVNVHVPASSRSKTTDAFLPVEGFSHESVINDMKSYLENTVKTHKPGFMNPLWGGFNIASFAGEVIAAASNTSMYTYELAPVATIIEKSILERMREYVGFKTGFGTFTTGGSNGNMLGVLCGRQKAFPNSTYSGIDGTKLAIFVSEESHYSVLMSANVIGIGHGNVIKVKCDNHGTMLPSALEDEINLARRRGLTPICVIATAGTTVRGAFDPLKEIGHICEQQEIWYHVDAAWGGACLFSPKHRSLMDGVEYADSVCWDAHKMMGVPLICSAFIIKQPEILRAVSSHGDSAHYLFHDDAESVDLGRFSLQCGRRNDALKLWFAWRMLGDSGWAKLVDDYMSLAKHLEEKITASDNLEMMSSRMWTNVCFRYTSEDINNLNEFNSELRTRLIEDGKYMISKSNIGDDVILRPVIANPSITTESLDGLIHEILNIGKDIQSGIPSR